MKHKEKEYLIAFKLYIDNYDSRYRYPKYIKAINKKDAITKYIQIIKPDLTLGACIIMDERPVKQDETKEEQPKNINDVYREGNLKLLEMMISQLNNLIEPANIFDPINSDHTPRQSIIDMDEINEKLCSTSRLANMLSSGVSHDMLPDNGCIYTDEFLGNINEYMDGKYVYEFYNDYTLAKIRDDLQRIYDCYNKHGVLPWQTDKLEDGTCGTSEVLKVSDFPAVVNREDSEEDKTLVIKIAKHRTDDDKTPDMGEPEHDKDIANQTGFREYAGDLSHYSGLTKEDDSMKESIVKGDRTEEKKSIDIIEYEPQFDTVRAEIIPNFPYILEIDNVSTGVSEKHVVVITEIMPNCMYCNQWDNLNDNPHAGIVLTASEFHDRNAKLYKITGKDLK